MNLETIGKIRSELEALLAGQRLGKIIQLSRFEFVLDFRLPSSRYLFVSIEPSEPRIYLIRRRLRDLEKASINLSRFALILKKELSRATFSGIRQIAGERVLNAQFLAYYDTGTMLRRKLGIQLTGKSANLFLLDQDDRIIAAVRETAGNGQQIGDIYSPPIRPEADTVRISPNSELREATAGTLSEQLDAYYLEKVEQKRFLSLAAAARAGIKRNKAKLERLSKQLRDDIAMHGDPEKWKRYGDLLLANAATARRGGNKITVTDYFDDATPEIAIDADENDTITETAEKYFKRFTKARNAAAEITKRLATIEKELGAVRDKESQVETAIDEKDVESLERFAGQRLTPINKKRSKPSETASIARSFYSSDGFEILVGKRARDNDFLTFRIARSPDTWMHAADYPGSHVVVRNPNRKEIPQKTLLEAAQLAAFYSQGKAQPKAAVHYTLKKFVNKPRGAGPGLVSLASFKTLLVEPSVPDLAREPNT